MIKDAQQKWDAWNWVYEWSLANEGPGPHASYCRGRRDAMEWVLRGDAT